MFAGGGGGWSSWSSSDMYGGSGGSMMSMQPTSLLSGGSGLMMRRSGGGGFRSSNMPSSFMMFESGSSPLAVSSGGSSMQSSMGMPYYEEISSSRLMPDLLGSTQCNNSRTIAVKRNIPAGYSDRSFAPLEDQNQMTTWKSPGKNEVEKEPANGPNNSQTAGRDIHVHVNGNNFYR